nr:hypothetical protein OG781_22370 [Streptomyces sp. NBC_00830]
MTSEPPVDGVAAGQGRTSQQMLGLAALLVVPLLVVVSGLLVRSGLVGDSWCILALLSPLIGFAVWHIPAEARHTELRDGHLLTARTLCGRRTVDLTRLVKVRRIELQRLYMPAVDQLTIKDVHGVRLILDEGHDVEVREAIAQAPAGQIDVSRRAAERLGLAPSRSRPWQTYILRTLRRVRILPGAQALTCIGASKRPLGVDLRGAFSASRGTKGERGQAAFSDEMSALAADGRRDERTAFRRPTHGPRDPRDQACRPEADPPRDAQGPVLRAIPPRHQGRGVLAVPDPLGDVDVRTAQVRHSHRSFQTWKKING